MRIAQSDDFSQFQRPVWACPANSAIEAVETGTRNRWRETTGNRNQKHETERKNHTPLETAGRPADVA